MDNDPLTLLLKFGFLAVLYLFLLFVARSASRDVAGRGEDALVADGPPRSRRERTREEGAQDPRAGLSPRLEVVAALGYEPGTSFDVAEGATLGRADTADIRIEDSFASSAHARLYPRGESMYVEDMGSTNGTQLNGRPLRRPEKLNVADTVRIGETEYRYRE